MTADDNGTLSHSAEGHSALPTPILFIFGACAVGAASRTILKKIPQLPYTVVLLIFGAIFGAISSAVSVLHDYTTMASMDPHTILHVFLPVLIFESAYAMEAHTFLKSFLQIMILAILGLGVATCLTAVFCINVFSYEWSWYIALMFGSLISATDPVAVVALLKELGASKQLGIMLEGESLLNDGAAIVLFDIFMTFASGATFTASEMVLLIVMKAIVGPFFGFVMGKITIFWLVNIFNDALTEITITLASTYITFYVCEGLMKSSGVLAVVVLGVTLSSNKTCVSPEVETFLHRFWEMLAYLANTLIFILVGVVIIEKAAAHITGNDMMLNVALYCAITVIRGLTIAIFSPLLSRIGYGLTWQNSTVMIWGGLRGAVGLALALIASQKQSLDLTGVTQNKILLHTAGIVLWTLVLNATTIQPLLKILGMSEISIPKRMAMASAVRNLQEVVSNSINMYKTDRFLADADWDIVEKYIDVQDPYHTLDEEAALDNLTNFERTSKCPKCATEVPNEPSPKEWEEMRTEARLRLLKAEKISYWKQFEHGMLSREAVRKLIELVDVAADEEDGLVNIDEIKKTWLIRGFYAKLRVVLERWQSNKPDASRVPPPSQKVMKTVYKVCMSQAFEIIMNIVIIVNVVVILLEMIEDGKLCNAEMEAKYGEAFAIINYTFIVIYTFEATFKIVAFRKHYFKSKWNLFDFLVLLLAVFDVILDLALLRSMQEDDCGEGAGSSTSAILSPNLLKMVKAIKLLRLLRSLRLVKGLIPQVIDFVDHQINKMLRFGYDVGKGYVMGAEEVQNFIEHMIDNKKIAKEFKLRLMQARLTIIRELGLLQKQHPGVAVSIKTQQAARRTLNSLRDTIGAMRGEGVIDDQESHKLEVMVEMRMKKLLKIPPTIQPPPPEKIIGNLSWVKGDETLIQYIKHNAELETMADGEKLEVEADPKGGIYVIISGLVKVDKEMYENIYNEHKRDRASRALLQSSTAQLDKISDYLTTGSVLGEMALLTGHPSHVSVTCETSVQMYHIPYEAIQAALELFTDEPSLEYRLWRVCATRTATIILKNQPHFFTWTHERVKMHLEKCVLYIKKIELPEGGKIIDYPTFDINSMHMSDIVLIHGEAEDPDGGRFYIGPCYIPNKVERLILIPGKTDKHVLVIMPRDTNEQMVVQSDPTTGSATNIVVANSVIGPGGQGSAMCLNHASKERVNLNKAISHHKYVTDSHGNVMITKGINDMVRKLSRKRVTNADNFAESDNEVELKEVKSQPKNEPKQAMKKNNRLPPLPLRNDAPLDTPLSPIQTVIPPVSKFSTRDPKSVSVKKSLSETDSVEKDVPSAQTTCIKEKKISAKSSIQISSINQKISIENQSMKQPSLTKPSLPQNSAEVESVQNSVSKLDPFMLQESSPKSNPSTSSMFASSTNITKGSDQSVMKQRPHSSKIRENCGLNLGTNSYQQPNVSHVVLVDETQPVDSIPAEKSRTISGSTYSVNIESSGEKIKGLNSTDKEFVLQDKISENRDIVVKTSDKQQQNSDQNQVGESVASLQPITGNDPHTKSDSSLRVKSSENELKPLCTHSLETNEKPSVTSTDRRQEDHVSETHSKSCDSCSINNEVALYTKDAILETDGKTSSGYLCANSDERLSRNQNVLNVASEDSTEIVINDQAKNRLRSSDNTGKWAATRDNVSAVLDAKTSEQAVVQINDEKRISADSQFESNDKVEAGPELSLLSFSTAEKTSNVSIGDDTHVNYHAEEKGTKTQVPETKDKFSPGNSGLNLKDQTYSSAKMVKKDDEIEILSEIPASFKDHSYKPPNVEDTSDLNNKICTTESVNGNDEKQDGGHISADMTSPVSEELKATGPITVPVSIIEPVKTQDASVSDPKDTFSASIDSTSTNAQDMTKGNERTAEPNLQPKAQTGPSNAVKTEKKIEKIPPETRKKPVTERKKSIKLNTSTEAPPKLKQSTRRVSVPQTAFPLLESLKFLTEDTKPKETTERHDEKEQKDFKIQAREKRSKERTDTESATKKPALEHQDIQLTVTENARKNGLSTDYAEDKAALSLTPVENPDS